MEIKQKLGLWSSISIVVGSVIGSSIFMKPAIMASQIDGPVTMILVWMFAGFISLIGASINAEIGTLLPQTGGQYVYFQKMYSERFAFIYGWSSLTVINTAAIASIAYIFATYLSYFIELPKFDLSVEKSFTLAIPYIGTFYPLENIGVKCVTAFVILFLTFINIVSLSFGDGVQKLFAFAKIGSLILLILLVFTIGKGDMTNLYSSKNNAQSTFSIMGFVAALSGAFAAFDGWNNLGFMAGEIDKPHKNIPKALIFGLLICLVLYLGTNLAYLYMIPFSQMPNSSLVAADAIQLVLGTIGAAVISVLVMISTFGATNGNIMACSRVTYAMGNSVSFFNYFGGHDDESKPPKRALWLQCIIALLYVFSGTFDMLTDLFVFVTFIFYGFAAYGVFVMRKKMPNVLRPYKAWAYPYLPAFFVVFAFFYFLLTIINDVQNYMSGKANVVNSLLGLLLIVIGVLIYEIGKRKS